MTKTTLLIHGRQKDSSVPPLPADILDGGTVTVTEFTLNRSRDAGDVLPVEAADDDVLELCLQGGQRVWMTVADYRQELIQGGTVDAEGKQSLEIAPALETRGATRGILKWVVVGLKLIGLDLPKQCAGLIAAKIDNKAQLGLFHCPLTGDAAQLIERAVPQTNEPLLVFIH
ncbi:MAG TPA: hypothetical protein VFF03_03955, partial [Rhodocyclaceae bacterium]|nr:hypothetical protein [Rhodocyclaceae bacterium]